MFCKNCGSEVNEGTQFCPSCGAQMAAPEATQAPVAPQAPVYQAAPVTPTVTASNVLTFGILGLAFSGFVLGLIFSIIGRKKAKTYEQETGALTGQAKVGAILAKVGLILSIVMIVFWIIYAIVLSALGSAVAAAYYYY